MHRADGIIAQPGDDDFLVRLRHGIGKVTPEGLRFLSRLEQVRALCDMQGLDLREEQEIRVQILGRRRAQVERCAGSAHGSRRNW